MVELLAVHTAMQVVQVADGMPVVRDPVYLNPPGTYLAIAAGTLRLSKPLERHGARMPFDFFLRSLAEDCGERAICAILSGTGTDGSLGLKAVKEKGGLVIVQDPEEAATSRQRQILDLVLAGHPSKNIAADLGISQRTVDNHRAAIMRKTGSRSLPALIRTAIAAA